MAVGATAVWRIRTGGSDTNGGGYDAGIGGAGTDYSQQDAAQASGSNGTASGTTTFSDSTANAFTSAMVGNAIWIASGTGFTAGAYFVTGYTSASTVTLDRSPGTGTAAVWKLGGAWRNQTNCDTPVAGNAVYWRASGSATPSSPDYSWTNNAFATDGSNSVGLIRVIGENGQPIIANNGHQYFYQHGYISTQNLYFVGCSGLFWNQGRCTFIDCVFDQSGSDTEIGGADLVCIRCEFFSSVANTGTAGTSWMVNTHGHYMYFIDCNFHDTWGNGLYIGSSGYQTNVTVINCIISNCKGDGLSVGDNSNSNIHVVRNCTINANGGHGVTIRDADTLVSVHVQNCIISNHTGSGKYGLYVQANSGSQSVNDKVRAAIDYNCYYGNTTDASGITVGTTTAGNLAIHDTTGVDPQFTNASTETYSIGANLVGITAPLAGNRKSGMTAATSYLSPGAVQPSGSGGGSTYVINRVTNIFTGDDYAP
jgi:hypothetical protein